MNPDRHATTKTLRLMVTDPEGFGCRNLPHLAVALAHLDCRVRVKEPRDHCDIHRGRITFGAMLNFAGAMPCAPTRKGQTVAFEVGGPDAEAALPVIRETFQKGTENHLAVLRKYTRLNPSGAGWARMMFR